MNLSFNTPPPPPHLKSDLRMSRAWLLTGLFSLLLGGLLSLTLILGRAPIVNQWGIDPLFAKRCLVVHVNLTLTAWFVSLLVALFLQIPGHPHGRWRLRLSQFGIFLFVIAAFFPNASPILSNYVPALDHPIFLIGFSLFLIGALLSLFEPRLWIRSVHTKSSSLPALSQLSVQIAVAFYLLGFISLVVTSLRIVDGSPESFYEVLFWGPGHIFQLSHCAALIATWAFLLKEDLPSPHPRFVKIFTLVFLASGLISLSLVILGPASHMHRAGFTWLMRWGTWPTLLLFLLWTLKKGNNSIWRNFKHIGFWASLLLIFIGIILGSFIDHSTTLIPAHYHATIGSLTVAYMAVVYRLLPRWTSWAPSAARLDRGFFRLSSTQLHSSQLLIYGLGQAIFSLGFGFAGLHGLGRKIYGTEQVVRTSEASIGLGVMGLGGTLALFAGATFLLTTLPPLLSSRRQATGP